MILKAISQIKAKPFLKWAGGKTQLLSTIDKFLPDFFPTQKDVTYIEPFVGGGAMLFFMLQKYPNIKRAVINDINSHLINTYKVIKENPYSLIDFLKGLQSTFKKIKDYDGQKKFYLDIRRSFNEGGLSDIEEAAYMIFLNRTCFNGLYRENSKGAFNVPFGKYDNPNICDESLLLIDSQLLQKVEILNGDFSITESHVNGNSLIYLDPPYRPLNATSNFNSYVKESFNDDEQRRLKAFFASLTEKGCSVLLSNSDCKVYNEKDTFFDELYKDYFIERVYAKRNINANASKRGILTELLIRNYSNYQGSKESLF